ncbi:MAG TPA: hypothetical protein VJV78_08170 [Polyangiales bacterium]|nr:hypothetical protein [Polyangiales bacterium]
MGGVFTNLLGGSKNVSLRGFLVALALVWRGPGEGDPPPRFLDSGPEVVDVDPVPAEVRRQFEAQAKRDRRFREQTALEAKRFRLVRKSEVSRILAVYDQPISVERGWLKLGSSTPTDETRYADAYAIDPSAQRRVVVARGNATWITEDLGQTWQTLSVPERAWVKSLAIDGQGSIYVLTTEALFVREDGGWIRLALPDPPSNRMVVVAGRTPGQPLFVTAPPNQLLRSDDRGRSWRSFELFDPKEQPLEIRTLVIAGTQAMTLYAIVAEHLLRSDTGGSTWTQMQLPGRLPVQDLAVAERNPDVLAVGTEAGIFVSANRGGAWAFYHEGLQPNDVRALAVGQSRSGYLTLMVGNDDGLFEFTLDPHAVAELGELPDRSIETDRAVQVVQTARHEPVQRGDPATLEPGALVATPAQRRAQEAAQREARVRIQTLDRRLEALDKARQRTRLAQLNRDSEWASARANREAQLKLEAANRTREFCAKLRGGYKPTVNEVDSLVRDVEDLGIEQWMGASEWSRVKNAVKALSR